MFIKPKSKSAAELATQCDAIRASLAAAVEQANQFGLEQEQDAAMAGPDSLREFRAKRESLLLARDAAQLTLDRLEKDLVEAESRAAESARRAQYDAHKRKLDEFKRSYPQKYRQHCAALHELLSTAKLLDDESGRLNKEPPADVKPLEAVEVGLRERWEDRVFPPPLYHYLNLPGFDAGEPNYKVPGSRTFIAP